MPKPRFEFKGVAEVSDGDFDSTDVRIALRDGFDSKISLVHADVRPQRYSELRTTHRALGRRVLVVAVADTENQLWAAYIDAVPGKNHEAEVAEVQKHGSKLPKDDACHHFPQFDPAKYRR